MKKRYISAFMFICLVCIFSVLYFYTPLKEGLTIEYIRQLVASAGIFGPVLYGLVYMFAILLFIPATPLTVLSGILFGSFLGTIVVVSAATLSAMTAFGISRHFGKKVTTKFSGEARMGKWMQMIEDHCEHNGFVVFFTLRNLFLPYIILSYASGLVKSAKLRDFVLATFISTSIHSFLFVYLGDSLLKGPKALILPIVLIVLVFFIPGFLRKISGGKLD